MHLSNEFLIGITVAGVTGMISYLFSKYKSSSTEGCELKNIKDDLEDDDTDDEQFFDAESGNDRFMSEENLYNVKQSKSISELYKDAVEKQAFGDVEYHFEERTINSLAWKFNMLDTAMQKIQYKVDEQALMVKSLKSGMTGVRADLKTLIESFNESRIQTTSIERNAEKPNSCKVGILKTRITILEREVTKNSSKIIEMDHAFRTLLLSRGPAVTLPEENRFHRNPPNIYFHQPTTPNSSAFTPVRSPLVHSVPRPPPPPPPPPTMTTDTTSLRIGEIEEKKVSSSKTVGPDKKDTTKFCRIPITEEILRSVVLKPLKRT